MKKKINVAIKEIAYYGLSRSDIGSFSGYDYSDAVQGTNIHVKFQNEMIKKYSKQAFQKEVYVSDLIENELISMSVSGRIDGVLTDNETDVCIFEIKSTAKDINTVVPDDFSEHLGQAQCYGYLYAKQNRLERINISLVYINRENSDSISFEYNQSIDELKTIYDTLTSIYLDRLTGIQQWHIIRDNSIETLDFPYGQYREGQKILSDEVYTCIKDGTKLFATAPTGTGKTMGVLFPAIKALGAGYFDKLMYLTAKTVTSTVAVDAYKQLCKNGLNLKTVCITAKEKICPMDKKDCDPEKCKRANQYYQRARKCIKDMQKEQFFDREIISRYADEYEICPFELSLDLTNYCDLIICDYNYLFDPRVRLQRYFDSPDADRFCFLIDEAHNLVERGRDMFSCEISKKSLNTFKKSIKKEWKYIKESVNELSDELDNLSLQHFTDMKEGFVASDAMPENLIEMVGKCLDDFMIYDLKKIPDDKKDDFLDNMFNLIFFYKVSELFDKRYTVLYELKNNNISVKLMCLDPSKLLKQSLDMGAASVLFSATLEPKQYYMDLLGGDQDIDVYLSLDSPFPKENLQIRIASKISTKYRDRDASYRNIALLLKEEFSKKTGNYMVFFPSYAYLRNVADIFRTIFINGDYMEQTPYMNEYQRELFLQRFDSFGDTTLVAFAVMGGMFGEGIDLTGEKLSAAAIIGPGLPMVGPERELIKKYFDDNYMNGFDYSYTYPGFNRVLQAAGRVIRSETDTGFVLLIDSRFGTEKYKSMFPKWWNYSNI